METLINVRITKAGLSIQEVASYEANQLYGTSNLNTFRDGWRVLKTVIKERFRPTEHMVRRHPDEHIEALDAIP